MSDVAIRVEGLGKQYRLGGPRERYYTLRDQIRKWSSLRGLLRRAARAEHRPLFWALKDVSFEVEPGEVVGIIGRNGAGKSTLLKILSRITEPTEGEVDVHGRVGSLLEVGTGFHPELTGRENVYLNGAILGMRRAEIARKFDEIVAFAEVEKFIDTPVKHYSSGMYMRLAFAVAAHLEPEILIVDEVLAVGDAEFQKKCLGKMGDVAKGGRTVLFVSHNMQTIATLCQFCICLKDGFVDYIGATADGISRYYSYADPKDRNRDDPARRPGSGQVRILDVHSCSSQYRPDEPKRFHLRICRTDPAAMRFSLSAHLVDQADRVICQCDSRFVGVEVALAEPTVDVELTIREPWLKPGEYALDLCLLDGRVGVIDLFEKACGFQILPILPYPNSAPEAAMTQGAVLGDFGWTVNPSSGGHSLGPGPTR